MESVEAEPELPETLEEAASITEDVPEEPQGPASIQASNLRCSSSVSGPPPSNASVPLESVAGDMDVDEQASLLVVLRKDFRVLLGRCRLRLRPLRRRRTCRRLVV